MTARIIRLRGSDNIHILGNARTGPDIRMPDSVHFMSMCPTCRDLRYQEGFGSRTLVRLLSRNQPIEAYCVVCDGFWEIDPDERATLAKRLIG